MPPPRTLLLVGLAAQAAAQFDDFDLGKTVRGFPAACKTNFARFRTGTGQMWVNHKAANVVKRSVKKEGHLLSYGELQLIRHAGEDASKLLQASVLWLFAPELLPALLYFNPKALPSTFETEKGREKRHASMVRMRGATVVELLGRLEDNAAGTGKKALASAGYCADAEVMLRARGAPQTLAPVEGFLTPEPAEPAKGRPRPARKKGAGKLTLKGLPPPLLKACCKLIGASGPQPGPMRRAALGKHLEHLVEEDAVLARVGTASLTRAELLEACIDRGFGAPTLDDKRLRSLLDEWLGLVHESNGLAGEPHRVRLAAMGYCALASSRRRDEASNKLPRMLYAP